MNLEIGSYGLGIIALAGVLFFAGLVIVRPRYKVLIETMGKFSRVQEQGWTWIVPLIQRAYPVEITEQMVDAEEQEIITKDRLNAKVDAQVYFKVKPEHQSIKDSQYNVENYERQIVALSKTTLRNIIGGMSYEDANSKRKDINEKLQKVLKEEAKPWGLEIVRTEMKQIDPTKDVQESMNEVIKAENTKNAAIDLATAKETEADGERMAAIKIAEGKKEGKILIAQGQAEAIKLVNDSAKKYFVGNAKDLKRLEVTQASLENNSKVVLTEKGISPQLIMDAIPVKKK